MDLSLPGGGLELLQEIVLLPAAPPIIVVSGRVEAREEALDVGAAAFVAKPFDIGELADVVTRVLAASRSE